MKVLKKIKPLWNSVITTMELYEKDNYKNGVLDRARLKGSIKEYQTVIAVGDTVKNINPGDEVCIDPTRYMVMKHDEKSLKNGVIGDNMTVGYRFNTINLDGKECLKLFDQDIAFIIEESEDVDTGPDIVTPERPKIIL